MALLFGWNAGLLSCTNRQFFQQRLCKKLCSRKSEDGQAIKRYLLSGDGLDSRPHSEEFQRSGRHQSRNDDT